jgi:hypothetical protein
MADARKAGNPLLKRGDAAMQTLKQEQEKAEARREAASNGVYRFWIGKDPKNKNKYAMHEVVVLDDDATQAPFAHEHTVPGPGNNFAEARNHICVDEIDNCVLCRAREQNLGEEFKHPAYNMYVTVLDLTPYVIQNGARKGQTIDATRKLMVIPQASVGTFMKIFELGKKMHGTTRGIIMNLTKTQQQDARCGIPQMMDTGMLFDYMPDDELDEYANEEVKRDGKVIKPDGEDIEPVDYEDALAPPDQKVLRKLYNLPASTGSEDEQDETTGTSRVGRRRRGGGADTGSDEEAGGNSRVDAPPPRTRSQRAAQGREKEQEPPPADTTSSRRRRAASPANDEVEDAEVTHEEASPPRRRRGGRDTEIPF